MPYWNSRGLRGSTLEDLLNRTNEEYLKKDLAVIQKIPTSIKPVRLDKEKGVISLAYFEQRSTVDYVGNVQGIPVCFDAKETSKQSLPIANIHEHQMLFMEKFTRQQGLAFMIVQFSKKDRCFFIPFETIKKYWNDAKKGGRKSIPFQAFEEKYEVGKNGSYFIHYLEAINTYLCEQSRE
ncbi:MAG TPA: Holliday junction resolvase RecU [Eubacteriaceae bacterium]|nr:Holliday junction resolvase RecU [Eubacteriaceae bacterium]